jgi:hypothetical protein
VDRFAPTEEKPLTLTWQELCERLAPPPIPRSEKILKQLSPGGYVGLARNLKGVLEPFYFKNPDNSGKIGWLMKAQPKFVSQLATVYRVEAIDWGGLVTEPIPVR